MEGLWRMQARRGIGDDALLPTSRLPDKRRHATMLSNRALGSTVDQYRGRPRRSPTRSLGRTTFRVAVVGVFLCAGTALASPDARQLLTSALATLTQALGVDTEANESAQRPSSAGKSAQQPSTGHEGRIGPRVAPPLQHLARPSAAPHQHKPISPTGLTAVAASSTQIDLSWADVATETGYRVERSLDGATDWTTVATTGQDVTAQSDTGLSPGTTYYYRVFATNDDGDSPAADVALVSTNPF